MWNGVGITKDCEFKEGGWLGESIMGWCAAEVMDNEVWGEMLIQSEKHRIII